MNNPRIYDPTAAEFLQLCADVGVANWDDFNIAVNVLQHVQEKQEEIIMQYKLAKGLLSSSMQGVPLQPDGPEVSRPNAPAPPSGFSRPNTPVPPQLQLQPQPQPCILNAKKMPVLRRSKRLIEKAERKRKLFEDEVAMGEEKAVCPSKEVRVDVKSEVDRAWSMSPCVSHRDFVGTVKQEVDWKREEEEEVPLAIPLPDYEDEDKENCEPVVCQSPEREMKISGCPPHSPQGRYAVGFFPSNGAVANWRHPSTGLPVKKALQEIEREFARNRCKFQGRSNPDFDPNSDTESEKEFHRRCQEASPSPPESPQGEDQAEMMDTENNLHTIWGGGFPDWQ